MALRPPRVVAWLLGFAFFCGRTQAKKPRSSAMKTEFWSLSQNTAGASARVIGSRVSRRLIRLRFNESISPTTTHSPHSCQTLVAVRSSRNELTRLHGLTFYGWTSVRLSPQVRWDLASSDARSAIRCLGRASHGSPDAAGAKDRRRTDIGQPGQMLESFGGVSGRRVFKGPVEVRDGRSRTADRIQKMLGEQVRA